MQERRKKDNLRLFIEVAGFILFLAALLVQGGRMMEKLDRIEQATAGLPERMTRVETVLSIHTGTPVGVAQ